MLHCAGSLHVRQDDKFLHRAGLLDRVPLLREQLLPYANAGVAMVGERADEVLAAMLACQQLGCELLLLRESIPHNSDRWRAVSVSAVLGQDGLVAVPVIQPAATDGFCILIATSGTTGVPKVARHNVGSLIGRIRPPKGPTDGIRWRLTYHPASFAGIQVLLTAPTTGGELLATTRASVGTFAEVALVHKPTRVSGTPTFWRGFLLALGARAGEVPIAFATLGEEAVDQGTLDRIAHAFPGVAISHIYASTEAGALFAVRDGKAGFPADWLESGVDGVALGVVDGMFEVASPRAMDRYVSSGSTSPIGEHRWLRTGELVEVVADRACGVPRSRRCLIIGSRGSVGLAPYSASKAGLEGLTRALAREVGPSPDHGQFGGPRLSRDRDVRGARAKTALADRQPHPARPSRYRVERRPHDFLPAGGWSSLHCGPGSDHRRRDLLLMAGVLSPAVVQHPEGYPSESVVAQLTPPLLSGGRGPLFALHDQPPVGLVCRRNIVVVQTVGQELNRCCATIAMQARMPASQGVGTLVPDVYGIGDRSGEFTHHARAGWKSDVMTAVDWLRARPDPRGQQPRRHHHRRGWVAAQRRSASSVRIARLPCRGRGNRAGASVSPRGRGVRSEVRQALLSARLPVTRLTGQCLDRTFPCRGIPCSAVHHGAAEHRRRPHGNAAGPAWRQRRHRSSAAARADGSGVRRLQGVHPALAEWPGSDRSRVPAVRRPFGRPAQTRGLPQP